MRTALGILGVLVIVFIIYLLLPPATKQAVQFWKPDYSMPPEASASPNAIAQNPSIEPSATIAPAGFVAQTTPLPTVRASATPMASATPRVATGSAQVASANTSLPGTGDIFRDPMLLVLSMLGVVIAIVTGNKMSKYI